MESHSAAEASGSNPKAKWANQMLSKQLAPFPRAAKGVPTKKASPQKTSRPKSESLLPPFRKNGWFTGGFFRQWVWTGLLPVGLNSNWHPVRSSYFPLTVGVSRSLAAGKKQESYQSPPQTYSQHWSTKSTLPTKKETQDFQNTPKYFVSPFTHFLSSWALYFLGRPF